MPGPEFQSMEKLEQLREYVKENAHIFRDRRTELVQGPRGGERARWGEFPLLGTAQASAEERRWYKFLWRYKERFNEAELRHMRFTFGKFLDSQPVSSPKSKAASSSSASRVLQRNDSGRDSSTSGVTPPRAICDTAAGGGEMALSSEKAPNKRPAANSSLEGASASKVAKQSIPGIDIADSTTAENFSGVYSDTSGSVCTITQDGVRVTARNPDFGWSPAHGTVSGKTLTMFSMTATLSGKGLLWSNSLLWKRQAQPPLSIEDDKRLIGLKHLDLDRLFAFWQCCLKFEALRMLEFDVPLVDPVALEMWQDVQTACAMNCHKNSWFPFHTVLGAHEMYVLKQIRYAQQEDWDDYRRFLLMFIFRVHGSAELFDVQKPLMKASQFWKDPVHAFRYGSPMEKAIRGFYQSSGELKKPSVTMSRRLAEDDTLKAAMQEAGREGYFVGKTDYMRRLRIMIGNPDLVSLRLSAMQMMKILKDEDWSIPDAKKRIKKVTPGNMFVGDLLRTDHDALLRAQKDATLPAALEQAQKVSATQVWGGKMWRSDREAKIQCLLDSCEIARLRLPATKLLEMLKAQAWDVRQTKKEAKRMVANNMFKGHNDLDKFPKDKDQKRDILPEGKQDVEEDPVKALLNFTQKLIYLANEFWPIVKDQSVSSEKKYDFFQEKIRDMQNLGVPHIDLLDVALDIGHSYPEMYSLRHCCEVVSPPLRCLLEKEGLFVPEKKTRKKTESQGLTAPEALAQLRDRIARSSVPSAAHFRTTLEAVEVKMSEHFKEFPLITEQMHMHGYGLPCSTVQVQVAEFLRFEDSLKE